MATKISTKQIGDGNLPNKYWVSVSNDYYYYNPEVEGWDWISDVQRFEVKTAMLKCFTTYKSARAFIDSMHLGMEIDGLTVNSIFIEDRLSGELYHQTRNLSMADGKLFNTIHEDTKFTCAQLREHGQELK